MRLGVLPIGRSTFDVEYAGRKLAAALRSLDATGHEVIGARMPLLDEGATLRAIGDLAASRVDQVLVLQLTFTDARMIVAAAAAFEQPLSIWAMPEPRLGGRLRLNALCGLNLASHALGLKNRAFSWLYADPGSGVTGRIPDLLAGKFKTAVLEAPVVPSATIGGARVAEAIRGRRIARIGKHPAGFDTCAYEAGAVHALAGVEVDELELDDLFALAHAMPDRLTHELHEQVSDRLAGLASLNAGELDRSLRLKLAMDQLRREPGYDAFAIRCWPETFTEYGGAACAPAAMLGEEGAPCACEADVYGALTQLVLQEAARAPVFLSDLVDIDTGDNTGVIWHCGQAPYSMRDPEFRAEAVVHGNRGQPLLYQFPLKPGPVTYMRISQAYNMLQMVLGFGEMLRRPLAFSGTSGVIRFSRDAGDVLQDIMSSGLEHHFALAYGDHRTTLRGVAGALGLPLQEF